MDNINILSKKMKYLKKIYSSYKLQSKFNSTPILRAKDYKYKSYLHGILYMFNF